MPRRFFVERAFTGVKPVGALVSLAVHTALILPYVIARTEEAVHEDPIDQFVVFLVPPEKDVVSRASQHRGINWASLVGDGGAVDEPIEPTPAAPEELTPGRMGDTAIAVTEPVGEPEPEVEEALSEIEVDSVVARDPNSAAPVYPPRMLDDMVEGSTFVHYVVDTSGRVDMATIRVIRTTHPAFSRAVRDALREMRFRPAIHSSRKVRQWVEQNFAFRILRVAPLATPDTT